MVKLIEKQKYPIILKTASLPITLYNFLMKYYSVYQYTRRNF
jgi:hypothetical protein